MPLSRPPELYSREQAYVHLQNSLFPDHSFVKIALPYEQVEHLFWRNSWASPMSDYVGTGRVFQIERKVVNGIKLYGVPFTWPMWILTSCLADGTPLLKHVKLDRDELTLLRRLMPQRPKESDGPELVHDVRRTARHPVPPPPPEGLRRAAELFGTRTGRRIRP